MRKIIDKVDVICQHKADCHIIPLRLRFMDDDGEYQTYTIQSYREAEKKGTRTTNDGVYVTDSMRIFECMINVLNRKQVVRLYYDPKTSEKWILII